MSNTSISSNSSSSLSSSSSSAFKRPQFSIENKNKNISSRVNLFDTIGQFLQDDTTQSIFDAIDSTLNNTNSIELPLPTAIVENNKIINDNSNNNNKPTSPDLINNIIDSNNNNNNNKTSLQKDLIESDISNDDKDFDFNTIEVLDSLIDFNNKRNTIIVPNPITKIDNSNNNSSNSSINNNNSNNKIKINNSNNAVLLSPSSIKRKPTVDYSTSLSSSKDPNDISSLINDIDSLVFDLSDIQEELERSSIRVSFSGDKLPESSLIIDNNSDNNNNKNIIKDISIENDNNHQKQSIENDINNILNKDLPQEILDIMSSVSLSPPKKSVSSSFINIKKNSFLSSQKDLSDNNNVDDEFRSIISFSPPKKPSSSFVNLSSSPKNNNNSNNLSTTNINNISPKIVPISKISDSIQKEKEVEVEGEIKKEVSNTTNNIQQQQQQQQDVKRISLKLSHSQVPIIPSSPPKESESISKSPSILNKKSIVVPNTILESDEQVSQEKEEKKEENEQQEEKEQVEEEKQQQQILPPKSEPQPILKNNNLVDKVDSNKDSSNNIGEPLDNNFSFSPLDTISAISPPSSPVPCEKPIISSRSFENLLSSSTSSTSSISSNASSNTSQLSSLIQETINVLPTPLQSTPVKSNVNNSTSSKYYSKNIKSSQPKPIQKQLSASKFSESISSSPLSPSVLSSSTPLLPQLPSSPPNELNSTTTSTPSATHPQQKWVIGNSKGKIYVSPLSNSTSSIKTSSSSSDSSDLSVSNDSISSGISSSGNIVVKNKMKNHIWRKSNIAGPNIGPIAQHPRSITDPMKYYSFNRESVVNLDPLNNGTGTIKHRSTFPGVMPQQSQNENNNNNNNNNSNSSSTSNSLNSSLSSVNNTTTSSTSVSVSGSVSSQPLVLKRKLSSTKSTSHYISSPILTSSVIPVTPIAPSNTILIFDENGVERSSLSEPNTKTLSRSSSSLNGGLNNISSGNMKQRIDLENPSKVKKVKELLRNYKNKVITLINKVYREAENVLENKKEVLKKFGKRNRNFYMNRQFELLKLYREYYSHKLLTKELELELSKERIEFLKLKLIDIGNLIKLLDDYFNDGSSPFTQTPSGYISLTVGSPPTKEALNNYQPSSFPSSMSPVSSDSSLPTLISVQKKNIIVYSSFFLKTDILLNKNSYISRTKRKLKALYDLEKNFKLNYKIYFFNIYQNDSVEKRESRLKNIIQRAKKSKEIENLIPWDKNCGVQKEFATMMWDSRFMEGKQILQLINIIKSDCLGENTIRPIDIEVFVEKFCEHLINVYHLVVKPTPPSVPSSSPSHLSVPSNISNDFILNHNHNPHKSSNVIKASDHNEKNHHHHFETQIAVSYEELLAKYEKQYKETSILLSQLFKRCFYAEISPLIKNILSREVNPNVLEYSLDLEKKMKQHRGKSLKELNLLPSNFSDDFDWSFIYANGKNPFENSISLLNDLPYLSTPIDMVHAIQQAVSTICSTCNEFLNSATFGQNYQKVLENSSLLKSTRGGNASNRDESFINSSSNISISSASSSSSSENLSQLSFINASKTSVIHPHVLQQHQMQIKQQQHQIANRSMPTHTLSADDLFPVLIYCIMNSDILPFSGYICSFIEQFSSEFENSGEFGWCSVSFQAAIAHLNQM